MFVITGRREDVMTAKREIQLAADHFSQIRARRGSGGSGSEATGPSSVSSSSSSSSSVDNKSPKLSRANNVLTSAGSSSSVSPNDAQASNILTAKPSQILQQPSQQQTQQQQPVVVSVLGRASSVSPGSSPLCLAPLSINSDLFSSHG
jgi:hypothetical protein